MPEPSSCTAIIVAYESAHVLATCLQSLAAQGVQAIVVDNACTDASADIARAHGAKVISNITNEGFGRAMNLGVRAATTEYCLLINPDTTLDENCIEILLAAAKHYDNWGIIAPRIVEPDGRVFFQWQNLLATSMTNPSNTKHLPEGDCCTPFVSGACMLIKRQMFLDMGGFDPNIFLFYEDDDLCRRIMDAGKAIIYVHSSIIRHLRGKSVAPSLKNIYTVRYHLAWSKVYVCRKYLLPIDMLPAIMRSGGKFLLALCTFNSQKIARHWGSLRGNIACITHVKRDTLPSSNR